MRCSLFFPGGSPCIRGSRASGTPEKTAKKQPYFCNIHRKEIISSRKTEERSPFLNMSTRPGFFSGQGSQPESDRDDPEGDHHWKARIFCCENRVSGGFFRSFSDKNSSILKFRLAIAINRGKL